MDGKRVADALPLMDGKRPADALPATDDVRSAVLAACVRMLSYPDHPGFARELEEVRHGLAALGVREDGDLPRAAERLLASDSLELAEEYVACFDLNWKTTLHLTAQENGDERERGAALLELAHLFRAAGYVPADEQLADYLPQLLELLAVLQERHPVLDELEVRIARMCRRVCGELPVDSVYRSVFSALIDILPDASGTPAPSDGPSTVADAVTADAVTADTVAADAAVEEDPEDMPYPLHYE